MFTSAIVFNMRPLNSPQGFTFALRFGGNCTRVCTASALTLVRFLVWRLHRPHRYGPNTDRGKKLISELS